MCKLLHISPYVITSVGFRVEYSFMETGRQAAANPNMQPFGEATSPLALPTGSRPSLRAHPVSLGFALLLALCSLASVSAQSTVLFGNQNVVTGRDYNSAGAAEAFQVMATSVGTLNSLTIYLDGGSAATTMYAGLYADSSGSPGTMLTKGSIGSPTAGAWNIVNVTPASIVSGGHYWLAILGTGGTLRFRDAGSGGCISQSNAQSGLSALPATWSKGASYADCPLSGYGSGSSGALSPILSVSTNSVAFSMVVGGANPSAAAVNVSNTGGSTLSFTASVDAAWLSVSPASGTAPQTLQISVNAMGFQVGVYTGHVTVAAAGAQGSPQVITVALSVSAMPSPGQPGDWLTVDHDPARTGFASDETILSPSNVGGLTLGWSAALDGQITAQPLFAGGIAINGTTHDIVIAATSGNSVYALDAATGTVLWKQNLGAQSSNCVFPGGFGVTGAPKIDRARSRVYAVSSGGVFYSLSLLDGSIAGQTPSLIANPVTNNVWGGLNQTGSLVYFVTGSDGCDDQPWQGTIYKVNVSGSTPVLALSVPVVPSLASTGDAGGGIWGYGGVALDTATGNVYVTAAKDVNEATTPNANRMLAYDSNLNLLGSYLPTDPANFPCLSQPCDLDFGSSPTVFQPTGCPQLVLGGKKNGNLYLFRTSDLMASGQPLQTLQINAPNDSLGNGGAADPSYWPTGNMVFEGTAGTGANGFAGGIVALNVTASCTMTSAWSHPLGASNQPNSTVTIANGVAFIAIGEGGQVNAYNATNGTLLWQSASGSGYGFAAPMVAKGTLYAGSWNGYGASAGGTLRAYTLNGSIQPTTLTVSPTTLTFNAVAGGSDPASQDVSVGNSGGGTLSFTTASDASWLTVTPSSGTAPQTLTIRAAVGSLPVGTLTGQVTITASGAMQSPQTVTATFNISSGSTGPTVLMGDQTVESQLDSNPAGIAEAFQSTAVASGTADSISFYVAPTSSATQMVIGVYSDKGGHPGTLLAQTSTSQLVNGGWNTLALPNTQITQGSPYWIAILGTSGTVRFQDRSHGGCSGETNATNNLTTLPALWTTGQTYTDCPLSSYISH
jgi:outer membrane protein assembly factor BamB